MPLKKILPFAGVLLVAIAGILLYPTSEVTTISIPLPIERALGMISEADNVTKWYRPFTEAGTIKNAAPGKPWTLQSGSYNLALVSFNTYMATLSLSGDEQKLAAVYRAAPDSNYIDQTKISLAYKKNYWGNFNGRNKLIALAEENLKSLEGFANNTLRLYGYDIRQKTITDSSYLFTQQQTSVSNLSLTVQSLYKQLAAFAEAKNVAADGPKIVNIRPVSKDSVVVSVGLSIPQYLYTAPGAAISYRTMPFGKKLLETTFKGRYTDLPNAFQALDQYARDHRLTNMAIPYGRFPDAKTDYANGDIIDMLVYFPVD